MNWIKTNKFLFGFLVAMVVGGGLLTFLLLGAMAKHEAAMASYEEQAAELNRLKTLPVFPSESNLTRLAEQKKQMAVEVAKLTENVTTQQFPLEEVTPEQFQDRLRASISSLRTKASQVNPPVTLPTDRPFFGFERYETAPPDREAAAPLLRQLKTIEWVVAKLIETRVVAIRTVNRPELPEERDKAKADDKKPGKPEKASAKTSVVRHPFEVTFIADQSNFRQALNSIVEFKGQFLIPRLITVKNEKDKGPARLTPAAAAALINSGTAPVVPGGSPQPGAAPKSEYIVGEERVEVTLVLEMAEFPKIATATEPSK